SKSQTSDFLWVRTARVQRQPPAFDEGPAAGWQKSEVYVKLSPAESGGNRDGPWLPPLYRATTLRVGPC
ncbi:MAG TPA: hypothetical protein VLY63_14935, partial [Anaerolineae bacterium]|nr:hypothetical protein [Anaerolineae bacterium]